MPDVYQNAQFDHVRRRILVVEDEMINREILGLMLRDTYDIIFAETGKRALEVLKTDFDSLSLVLLDLNLPDMNGMDIMRSIKESADTALLPIIVMTSDQDQEVECLTIGATDFISKPYPKQEIVLARIRRTIELFEDRDLIRWTERDTLTGLYNREFFYRYALQFDAHHSGASTDAIILDINRFHMINERYGREFGDKVLKIVAEQLLESVSDSDGIVCRKEDDTFLVYCLHRDDYGKILEDICKQIGTVCQARARMGVYPDVDRGIDMDRRFDCAKQAAEYVKNSYIDAVGYYDAVMHEHELYDEQLLEDFHTAIREKQFVVYYQPKYDIRPDVPVLNSAEALIRWQHPKLGFISPGRFIPLFERNGLIRELDYYVWREAAIQNRTWRDQLGKTVPISVNVSRVDLNDPPLLEKLDGLVLEAGTDCDNLHLEITETAYTDDADQIINVVTALRERGFFIEMDDFGTGYSSLNMITTLPIDALKLDMHFIRTAFSDRKDTRLIAAVIGLAKTLGLLTIAEGVETAEQLDALKELGCDIVQGYYFSKPIPADEFEAFILETGQKSDN